MSVPMFEQISAGSNPATYVRPAKANVFIGDVSGSMSYACPRLAEDMCRRIDQLPHGDMLIVGIFSQTGWYEWIITRELGEKADYEKCKATIKSKIYGRSMTCFSEILLDTPKQIHPLLQKFPVVTFTFFSDGLPNAYPIDREMAGIEEALKLLAPMITAGSVVSYGDWADRKLLAKMAQSLGVEFVSTDDIRSIGETFERVTKKPTSRRKAVKVPKTADFAFALTPDGSVTTLDPKQEEALVDEHASVYMWAEQFKGQTPDSKTQTALDVQYAAALSLLSSGRIDEAINFLSALGDVALVELLGNALTNAELSIAEAAIREAVVDEKKRFTKGQKPHCLPEEDAFDLMDLLGHVMGDSNCKFYPFHPDFKYKRIGRSAKARAGYPEFHPDARIGIPVSGLVGNQSELNLSVLTRITGTIDLPDSVQLENATVLTRDSLNLPKKFNTCIWRNYALISDAKLGVKSLPLSIVDPSVYKTLAKHDLLPAKYTEADIYPVDLTKIPMCNKKRGKEAADWQRIADLAYDMLEVGSVLKVLKAKRDELDPSRESELSIEYTSEQWQFLNTCGINRKGEYAPPTDQEEATDVLSVRTLEAKIDKGSSVSVAKFYEQLTKGKLNFVGSLMKVGHDLIEAGMPKTKGEALTWLHGQIKAFTETKRTLDQEFNARRFAAVLNGLWGKSFKEDEAVFMCGPEKKNKVTLVFKTIEKRI